MKNHKTRTCELFKEFLTNNNKRNGQRWPNQVNNWWFSWVSRTL